MRISLAAVVAIAACTPAVTQVAPTNAPPRPMTARVASEVAVYVGRRPAADHIDVAIIQPPQAGTFGAQMPAVIDAVRTAAAELGCDGVVIEGRQPVWGACILFTAPVADPTAMGMAPAATAAPAVSAAPATAVVPTTTAEVVVKAPARPAVAKVAAPVAPRAPARSPGAVLESLFPRLDRDHNGRLGPDELPRSSGALIGRIDTNHDGWVTAYELRMFNQAEAARAGGASAAGR